MAYTIKGLAKANECNSHDAYGLTDTWIYWFNCGRKKQVLADYERLNRNARREMISVLKEISPDVADYLLIQTI